jgi:hypothetical protein
MEFHDRDHYEPSGDSSMVQEPVRQQGLALEPGRAVQQGLPDELGVVLVVLQG